MYIHEYQAKELYVQYGIKVPKFGISENSTEAHHVAKEIGGKAWAIKAQIYSGGRGKAGGVKVVSSLDAVRKTSSELFGQTLVTRQTGEEGRIIHTLLIEEAIAYSEQYYISLSLDRLTNKILLMLSKEGGQEIEVLAEQDPDAILKLTIEPTIGLSPFMFKKMSCTLGLKAAEVAPFAEVVTSLYKLFCEKECLLAEINPLVKTATGEFIALDAKLSFDDNSLVRHPDIMALSDPRELSPAEIEAQKYGLSYISLPGNIGCLVNGAGLAMATADTIQHVGGRPANFLDIGGSASQEVMEKALTLLIEDPHVEGILVNIFGGITRCDVVAQAIINVFKRIPLTIPLVIRLEGTNRTLGYKLLQSSELPLSETMSMTEAAKKIVELVKTKKVGS